MSQLFHSLGSKAPHVDHRKLAVQMPKERADRFESVMRARGKRSAADGLRSLIDSALSAEGDAKGVTAERGERPSAQGRTRRLWVHVKAGEAEEIRNLAAPFGGVAAWFRGIVDARVGRARELPAREEIEALHRATVQLGRLGTNLNQIARALNTARLAGEPIPSDGLRPDDLAALKTATEEVSARANAVILAARRRVFNE